MSHVIDANSLLNITRELGEDAVDVLEGETTASLAHYEVGNALWKKCNLFDTLTLEKAEEVLDFVDSMLKSMDVISLRDDELGGATLRTAYDLNVTFYDATYLTVAKNLRLPLVTDDGKLREVAEGTGLSVLSSDELIGELGRSDDGS